MKDFKELIKALKEGKIVAFRGDKTGGIEVAGAFSNNDEARSIISVDDPKKLKDVPKTVFVKIHKLPPLYYLD